jgi:hypothetical protein
MKNGGRKRKKILWIRELEIGGRIFSPLWVSGNLLTGGIYIRQDKMIRMLRRQAHLKKFVECTRTRTDTHTLTLSHFACTRKRERLRVWVVGDKKVNTYKRLHILIFWCILAWLMWTCNFPKREMGIAYRYF